MAAGLIINAAMGVSLSLKKSSILSYEYLLVHSDVLSLHIVFILDKKTSEIICNQIIQGYLSCGSFKG
jgi:hypothetical protein